MNAIKLVVVDIDGTILHDDKTVDRHLFNVVQQLKQQGIAFTYATGRNIYSTLEVKKDLPFDHPFAINNGAMIYTPTLDILHTWSIPKAYINKLLEVLNRQNQAFLAYSPTALIHTGTDPILDKFRQFLSDKLPLNDYLVSRDYSALEFYKITVNSASWPEFNAFLEQVTEDYPDLRFARNEGPLYVISSPEATKGQALERICREMGLALQECMVIGDNHNDRSMLEESGVAVAMGNSELEILDVADIVIGSNNDDGVSRFLRDYFSL